MYIQYPGKSSGLNPAISKIGTEDIGRGVKARGSIWLHQSDVSFRDFHWRHREAWEFTSWAQFTQRR